MATRTFDYYGTVNSTSGVGAGGDLSPQKGAVTLKFGDGNPQELSVGETVILTGGVKGEWTFAGVTSNGELAFTGKGNSGLLLSDNAISPGMNWAKDIANDIDAEARPVICFYPGTLIATPDGPRAVETLQPGDLVCTESGYSVPVVWMGRQTVHKLFTPAQRFCPIRIRAGALGPGVPNRDLLLTGDHALMLDGLAVNAAALVNGRSILREPKEALPETITYWHIETAQHDVVLAEGAPAETFVDNVTRQSFDNYADYEARFGPERRHIEQDPAPRVGSRRQLPEALRARLAARADELELEQGESVAA